MIILLIFLSIIVILIGVYGSSTIFHIISPSTTPHPTIAHLDVNSTLPDYTSTPDPYTSTIEGLKVNADNYNDSNGLTTGQKMDAILLAINNSTVRERFSEYESMNSNLSIGPVIPSMADYWSGYLKHSDMVNVPIILNGMPLPEDLIVYVDIKNNTIDGVEGWWSRETGPMDTSIPPGDEWYHRLMGPWINASGDMSRIEMHFRMVYSPGDARLYPIIVDDSNFSLIKNGSMFSPVRYVDYVTNQTMTYADNTPVVPEWTSNGTSAWEPHMSFGDAVLPYYYNEQHPAYYVIIKNVDSRPVQILEFDDGL
jgi:hypothetical protein